MAAANSSMRRVLSGVTSACTKNASRLRLWPIFSLALLLFFCDYLAAPLHAAETVFTSTTELKRELSRLSEQGTLFVTAPADPYLPQTAAFAGVFALTYLLDRDIGDGLSDAESGTLTTLTDVGNAASNPFLHLGAAALLYGAGAATDRPEMMQLGQELGEALVLADGATLLLKEAIGRGRPHTGANNSNYRPFQHRDGYGSLPSMHTASSFAVAHILSSKTESFSAKLLYYTAAGFAGFSRVYQGKHWATDVLLGAAIGELAGDAVTRYYASKRGELTVAPLAIGGVPSLAVMGKF